MTTDKTPSPHPVSTHPSPLLELSPQDIEQLTFDEALDKMSQVSQQLEQQQVPLEQAVSLYQMGLLLSEHCQKRLDQAKLTLEQHSSTSTVADRPISDNTNIQHNDDAN